MSPRDAVSEELSNAVVSFVGLADGNLNFALSNGNLDRYLSLFREVRSKMTGEDHEILRGLAEDLAREMFPIEQEESDDTAH